MKAKQEIDDLGAELADDFVVAVRPDHPLLLVGPDVLVSRDGNLAAIFVLKADETESPDRVLIRLAFSRLALPNHLRCILIGDPLGPRLAETLQPHFHRVFHAGNHPGLAAYIMNPTPGTRVGPVPDEIKDRAFRRFDALYSVSVERASAAQDVQESAPILPEQELYGFESLEIRSWTGQLPPFHRQPRVLSSESVLLGQVEHGKRNVLGRIRTYCNASCLLDFSLDMGIPYPREKCFSAAKIMAVDHLPVLRGDPFKYVRAAAFAGWSVARVHSVQDIDDIGRSIKARLEDQGHEHL